MSFNAAEVAMDLSKWRLDSGQRFLLDTSERPLGPGAKRGLRRDSIFKNGVWPAECKGLRGNAKDLAASHALAAALGESQPTIQVALCTYEAFRSVELKGITQPFVPEKGRPAAPALPEPCQT